MIGCIPSEAINVCESLLVSVTYWLVTAGTKCSLHCEHSQAVCEHEAAPGDRAGAGVPLLP